MAFTEAEAKVLGALSNSGAGRALKVGELCRATGLCGSSLHRALLRLARAGLVVGSREGVVRWSCTGRGRVAIGRPVYREFVRGRG